VRKLADAYQHLTPAPDDLLPAVNRVIFRQVRVRRWMRVLRWIAILAFVLAALWGVYKLYEMVQF
jgi:hypothetical protein